MIKVLEFFCEPLVYGGEESFMVNMYKNFTNKISYTIATPFNLTNKNLINLAKDRNENIVHYDYDTYSSLRRKYAKQSLKDILSKEKYDVIHIHSSSLYLLYNSAKIAKKNGIKKIIVHSHLAAKESLKHFIFKKITDLNFKKYADIFFACSQKAGEFQYPKSIINSNKYFVIKNGIDIKNFLFNNKIMDEYRKEFNLGDDLAVLNVGRFARVKNHKFIIEIVDKLKDKLASFKIILVGDGELKEQTLQEIKNRKLEKYFIILEKRSDVAEIMMASDMFILPSLFEGLPVTLIESQASGLVTLASDTITKETKITNLYESLSIEDPNLWVDKILEKRNLKIDREQYANIVKENGYDAKTSAEMLEKIYLE